jgi:hypothetical protein
MPLPMPSMPCSFPPIDDDDVQPDEAAGPPAKASNLGGCRCDELLATVAFIPRRHTVHGPVLPAGPLAGDGDVSSAATPKPARSQCGPAESAGGWVSWNDRHPGIKGKARRQRSVQPGARVRREMKQSRVRRWAVPG